MSNKHKHLIDRLKAVRTSVKLQYNIPYSSDVLKKMNEVHDTFTTATPTQLRNHLAHIRSTLFLHHGVDFDAPESKELERIRNEIDVTL